MRGWLGMIGLLVLVVAAGPGRAETPLAGLSEADRVSIRGVIGQQMRAFQADDAALAFSFATPGLQQMFGTAGRFMAMVRSGYGPVYRAQEVQFLDLIEFQGQPTQRVLVVGADRVALAAYYMMERQADGHWRISGCILRRLPEVSI